MNRRRQITIHLGGHKTGSSSIQYALTAARDILWENGRILYPKTGFRKVNHVGLAHEFTGKFGKTNQESLPLLKSEVGKAEPNHIILSAEAFENVEPKLLANKFDTFFANEFDTSVLMYIRSPASLIISQYDQRMMHVWDARDFDAHIAHLSKNYKMPERLNAWEASFPGRVIVRPFSKNHLIDNDIVQDFFVRFFGKEHQATHFARTLEPKNLGRPAALVLLMERVKNHARKNHSKYGINTAANVKKIQRKICEIAQEKINGKANITKLRWPGKALRDYYKVSIDGIRWIDDQYFKSPILEEEMDRILDATPPDAGPLTLEEALDMDGTAIDEMVLEILEECIFARTGAARTTVPI